MGKSRIIAVIILIFLFSIMTGCSKNTAQKKPTENGQSSQAPTELQGISSNLDTIIAELDKKLKARNGGSMQQQIQLNPQQKAGGQQGQAGQTQGGTTSGQQTGGQTQNQTSGNQQQNNQKQGSQSASTQKQNQNSQSQGEQQGGQQQQAQGGNTTQTTTQSQQSQGSAANQAQTNTNDWSKEFQSMRDIHQNWNKLMPEAVQAGMSTEARNQFSQALDQLTQAVSSQQLESSMSAALALYKNYADMARLFSTQVPAELYQVKYEIMTAVFEASQKNWTKAEEHIPKMREQWMYLGAQAKNVDTKLLSQTEFSISDLQDAIRTKQADLIMIKGEIAMTNLNNLQNKMSNQSSGQGQMSGQNQSSSQGQNSNQGSNQTSGQGAQ